MSGPFDREHTDAWCAELPDVEALNKSASDAVLALVERVRSSAARGALAPPASCALILGPAGAGKTHLFARWRKRLGSSASFALVRPGIGVEITPRYALREVVDALARAVGSSDLRQLDLVALRALAHATEQRSVATADLLHNVVGLDDGARRGAVERALDAFEGIYPGIATTWLDRLLRVPFASTSVERRALHAYLSGREPDEMQLARLGLREGLAGDEALNALRSLAVVAAVSAPLVLVFDQLENLAGGADHGPVRAYASLISELHDTVPGAVVVQMALDAEWDERIRPALAAPQRTRVEGRRLTLALPRPEECEALIRCWVAGLSPSERRGDFPAPFTGRQVDEWCATPAITPRQLMIACREALRTPARGAREEGVDSLANRGPASPKAEADERADKRNGFEALWGDYMARARRELDDASRNGRGLDESRLSAALYATVAAADSGAVAVADRRASHQIEVRRADGIGRVFLLQDTNARSAATKLAKVLEVTGTAFVLRERAFALPPSWKQTLSRLTELRARRPSAFLEVDREDLARMLALHDMISAARSGDLTDPSGRVITPGDLDAWVSTERCAPARWSIVDGHEDPQNFDPLGRC